MEDVIFECRLRRWLEFFVIGPDFVVGMREIGPIALNLSCC